MTSREEHEDNPQEVEVHVRWSDCFKFWVSGFIFMLIVTVIGLLVIAAA